MAKKQALDDKVFRAAKEKIAKAIDGCDIKDVSSLTSLVNSLVKIKTIEMRGEDEGWGGELGGDA
jgi:hypothetical protein